MDPTEQMLNHYDAACKISRESTIYDQLGSHFASMNQYENPSESNAQHKSLMRERRSMTQYLAVTIQLRLKKIYIIADMHAKPTPLSSTGYDELGSHLTSKSQYEKPSESKAKHKSLMCERRSIPQYLAVTKQLRLEKINNIAADILQRPIVMSQRQTDYRSTPTLHDNRALKLSHRGNLNQYYCFTNKHHSHSIITIV